MYDIIIEAISDVKILWAIAVVLFARFSRTAFIYSNLL